MKIKLFVGKSLLFLVVICFYSPVVCFAQQNVSINDNGFAPDGSAMLDISSPSKGLLIPRVSLLSTIDVATIQNPQTSLLVYNTNAAMVGGELGFWYWDGAQWVHGMCTCPTGPTGPAGPTGTNGTNGTNGAPVPTGPAGANGTNGAPGPTGPAGPTGSFTNNAWLIVGNAGTTAGTNFIGTLDAQDFVTKTNGSTATNERMRVTSGGKVVVNNITPSASDAFSVYGTGTAGAINSMGTNAIAGYSSSAGNGIYGTNNSSGYGVYGYNAGTGKGVYGESTGDKGIKGLTTFNNNLSGGLYGACTSTVGHGTVGSGNNLGVVYVSTSGAGVVGTGTVIGVMGNVASTTTGTLRTGGYFQSGSDGSSPNPNFSNYAYVGAINATNISRKIEGPGTVSTVVKDLNDNLVTLVCPEAPEILFEDYGLGELVNGEAHIYIDPIFSKNILVNEKHPLKVFIQLEGDCNGVYITNKTVNSFDVKELNGGKSNVKFAWHIVANRANEKLLDGTISPYADQRFTKAIPQQKVAAFKAD